VSSFTLGERQSRFDGPHQRLRAAQHRDVPGRGAASQCGGDALGQQIGFLLRVARLHQHRQRAAPPGAERLHQRQLVFAAHRAVALQQALCALQRQRQHLGGVAVVQAQDAGAAARLDADAGEIEPAPLALVDGLRVVVQHEQAVRGRAYHAAGDAQPGVFEIVRLVDEQCQVLAAGHAAAVHGALHGPRQRREMGVALQPRRHAELVAAHQVLAPAVEGAHLHTFVHTALAQLVADAVGQRAVEAQHQHRLVGARRGGQVLGAEDQDHGLARTRRAVDHAVALAQRARHLLLLQVHHLQQVGQRRRGLRRGAEVERGLRLQPHLGKQMPAHAVALRQRQRVRIAHGEHAPQAVLEGRGGHGLIQIVAQQRARGGKQFVEVAADHVGSPQRCQHHAPTVGKQQPAGEGAVLVHQRRVVFHHVHQFQRVITRLAQRVRRGDHAARRAQLDGVARGRAQRGGPPVLHLEQQDAPARAQHHEVGLARLGPDGDVVPDEIVVFQAALELVQHAALARIAAGVDVAQALREHSHGQTTLGTPAVRTIAPPSPVAPVAAARRRRRRC
jgi:hypothetical protein